MQENFDRSMPFIFSEEGGYSDNSKDPGGATNLGVTIGTWSDYVGRPVTKADMKALTKLQVTPLYKKEFWDAIRGDDLPPGLDYAVFDRAVNSGAIRAVKLLQQTLGFTGGDVDGLVGSQTLTAINAQPSLNKLIDQYLDTNLKWLKTLSTWGTFGKGWTARIERVRARAHKRVADAPVALPPAPPPVASSVAPVEPQSPKAQQSDVSITNTLSQPEAWGPLAGAAAGLGAVVNGTGPVQYALAAVLVIGVLFGLVYFIKRRQGIA